MFNADPRFLFDTLHRRVMIAGSNGKMHNLKLWMVSSCRTCLGSHSVFACPLNLLYLHYERRRMERNREISKFWMLVSVPQNRHAATGEYLQYLLYLYKIPILYLCLCFTKSKHEMAAFRNAVTDTVSVESKNRRCLQVFVSSQIVRPAAGRLCQSWRSIEALCHP